MGPKDRDDSPGRHRNPAGQSRPADRAMMRYLLGLGAVLLALWLGADALLAHRAAARSQAASAVELVPGGVVLEADRSGHFRGTALINGTPVPFLVDTGATRTVVPEKVAEAIGLPVGRTVTTLTAGGRVHDRQTTIDRLQIGNVVITDLEALINSHVDETLLGMNTLKLFRMSQEGDTLTLTLTTIAPSRQAAGR